ncbi:MAG: methyltransferase domain-containing protein [Candidatus Omnitrophica bacterium]|nr:methyltransferase domain-containing protein [Candidatus Omnitrophota bacterium]
MTQDKQRFYDRFADEFDSKMNMYDTEKRVRVLFDQLLPEDLSGKRLLDAGSGTGWFSKRATERGARVTSIDIGHQLLKKVGEKCQTDRAANDICRTGLASESFDFIVSSEVIEHVPEPRLSITELNRLLKPGGVIVLSTPNKVWHFAITLANKMGARPYEGYENWVGYGELRRWFEEEGLTVEKQIGLHLFPFVHPIFYPILDFMDRFGKPLGPVMLNQAIRARKPDRA